MIFGMLPRLRRLLALTAKFRGRMNSNLKGEDRSDLELYGVGIFGYRIGSGRGEEL
jgi:hypothetical protein